jgi:chaperone required for assembly of F1-ATPase
VKRFWDTASAEREGDAYTIRLDGKPLHLPSGTVLRVAHTKLVEAIATEWQDAGGGKGGAMTFADTPLTRLAGTAQERIAPERWPTVDAIARYGESDLLCYRAEAPEALVRRQDEAWQPWLDWVADRHNAPLRVTAGIVAVRQHRDSIAALREAVAAFDIWALAGLGVAVPALGSLVLGLALADGVLDPSTAHALGALDELYQVEKWGEDDEATARRAAVGADIAAATRLIMLTRS